MTSSRAALAATTTLAAAVAAVGLGATSTVAAPATGTTTAGATAAMPTGTAVFRDAHGDMAHGADLWRVRLTNKRMLRVDLTHDDLVRSFRSGSSGSVFLDTDRSRKGPEYVFSGGFHAGTDYQLSHADGWRAARPVHGRYELRLDYAGDVAHIRISRAALGAPGKVRVAVVTGGEQADGDIVRDWLGERRHFTDWVARG